MIHDTHDVIVSGSGGAGSTAATTAAGMGKRVALIDADPQGSALDWSQQRAREGLPRLFGVVGLARDHLHREAPERPRDADQVDIAGPPQAARRARARVAGGPPPARPPAPDPGHVGTAAPGPDPRRRPPRAIAPLIARRVRFGFATREPRSGTAIRCAGRA